MNEFFDDFLAPVVTGAAIIAVLAVVLFALESKRSEKQLALPTISDGSKIEAVKDRSRSLPQIGDTNGKIVFQKAPN